MTDDLQEITTELGKVDARLKRDKPKRDTLRKRFFDAITVAKKVESLAQKTFKVAFPCSRKDAEERAAKYNPGWRVLEIKESEGAWAVLLEEDPELLPFVYVNPKDKKVYQRSVKSGGKFLDDERIKDENPELWKKITYIPEPEVQIKPLEELPPEVVAEISEYFYEGERSVTLTAPREAKEEELADIEDNN